MLNMIDYTTVANSCYCLIRVSRVVFTCCGCACAQVAAQLASEMKVKALYKLLAGKMTAEPPHLETFLPPQLLQLIGRAVDLPVLHPTVAIVATLAPGDLGVLPKY